MGGINNFFEAQSCRTPFVFFKDWATEITYVNEFTASYLFSTLWWSDNVEKELFSIEVADVSIFNMKGGFFTLYFDEKFYNYDQKEFLYSDDPIDLSCSFAIIHYLSADLDKKRLWGLMPITQTDGLSPMPIREKMIVSPHIQPDRPIGVMGHILYNKFFDNKFFETNTTNEIFPSYYLDAFSEKTIDLKAKLHSTIPLPNSGSVFEVSHYPVSFSEYVEVEECNIGLAINRETVYLDSHEVVGYDRKMLGTLGHPTDPESDALANNFIDCTILEGLKRNLDPISFSQMDVVPDLQHEANLLERIQTVTKASDYHLSNSYVSFEVLGYKQATLKKPLTSRGYPLEEIELVDGSGFPYSGFISINNEIIYYYRKDGNKLKDLIRQKCSEVVLSRTPLNGRIGDDKKEMVWGVSEYIPPHLRGSKNGGEYPHHPEGSQVIYNAMSDFMVRTLRDFNMNMKAYKGEIKDDNSDIDYNWDYLPEVEWHEISGDYVISVQDLKRRLIKFVDGSDFTDVYARTFCPESNFSYEIISDFWDNSWNYDFLRGNKSGNIERRSTRFYHVYRNSGIHFPNVILSDGESSIRYFLKLKIEVVGDL